MRCTAAISNLVGEAAAGRPGRAQSSWNQPHKLGQHQRLVSWFHQRCLHCLALAACENVCVCVSVCVSHLVWFSGSLGMKEKCTCTSKKSDILLTQHCLCNEMKTERRQSHTIREKKQKPYLRQVEPSGMWHSVQSVTSVLDVNVNQFTYRFFPHRVQSQRKRHNNNITHIDSD